MKTHFADDATLARLAEIERRLDASQDLYEALRGVMKFASRVPDEMLDGEDSRSEYVAAMDAARAALAKAEAA